MSSDARLPITVLGATGQAGQCCPAWCSIPGSWPVVVAASERHATFASKEIVWRLPGVIPPAVAALPSPLYLSSPASLFRVARASWTPVVTRTNVVCVPGSKGETV